MNASDDRKILLNFQSRVFLRPSKEPPQISKSIFEPKSSDEPPIFNTETNQSKTN